MANVFLNQEPRDIETAIMLENAIIHDIGKAVAYTDGERIFINTDDNLFNILPAYDNNMLKWLLWHERMHKELRHHNRFFKYLNELADAEIKKEFHLSKDEVNIIMDILVHDSMSKMFPELIETAQNNLAQFRNRNSLGYTFTKTTLEEMLDEYKNEKDPSKKDETEETEEGEDKSEEGDDKMRTEEKGHGESPDTPPEEDKDDKGEDEEEEPKDEPAPAPEPEHDKTDWDKLKDIDTKEFINSDESDKYMRQIAELQRKKLRLAKLTETLNGLATTTRRRTYAMPSSIKVDGGVILKGSTPGKASLYLVFDASGSMDRELNTFKDIISKSIPHAMEVPCEWFSGYTYNESIDHLKNPEGRNHDYYKGQFKDIMVVEASSGYDDDGDRTIELCWKAEQAGYSPIGVTDGGGQLSWSKDMLKQLKRTILVGQRESWLQRVKEVNPSIQTIHI